MAPEERSRIESTVQGLSVQPTHKQALAAFVGASDLLISTREVVLPLSNRKILRAKILDTATRQMRRIAVENGQTTDALQALANESALRRAKYAAMQPAAFARLEDQNNKVLVWVRTPSLAAQTSLPDAALKAKLAQDKGPFLAGLAKMAGVKLERNLLGLPMVELTASKAAVLALATRPDVARIDPVVHARVQTMAVDFTEDQKHAYWDSLFWEHWQWPITSDVKIAMIEQCHPDPKLRTHNPASGSVAYLPGTVDEPLGTVTTSFCDANASAADGPVAHANRTHSILYGHPDYQNSPAVGLYGMLNALTRPVSSIALNTIGPLDECFAPSNANIVSALDQIISRAPGSGAGAAPDVISISAWQPAVRGEPLGANKDPDPNQTALDWMTVMRGSHPLVVMAAGNDGYEPPSIQDEVAWGYCRPNLYGCNLGPACQMSGSAFEGGSGSCMDGVDNDYDGLIDCDDTHDQDDSGCAASFACKNRHTVLAKIYNGIVVGSAKTEATGFFTLTHWPNQDSMGHQTEGTSFGVPNYARQWASHSSWRPMRTTHDDLRLPHVVASGVFTQAADNLANCAANELYWSKFGDYWSCDPQVVGTSFSTPQVAGYAAYAYRAALSKFPSDRLKALEAARAIVIASARHNVLTWHYANWPSTDYQASWVQTRSRLITGTPNSTYDQRRHRDGAGMIDGAALGILLNGAGSWVPWFDAGSFIMPPAGPPPAQSKEPWVYPGPPDGQPGRVRIALTWHPYAGEVSTELTAPGYDLDVCVFNATTQLPVACANSWDNTYEFLDIDVTKGVPYYTKVIVYSGPANTEVKYGLAHYFDAYHPGLE